MIYARAVKNIHRTVIAHARNHVATRTAGDEMSWIHVDESRKGRIAAIRRENERLIQLLISMGVLREHMYGKGWQVIYSEHGPLDLAPGKLNPCYKPFIECSCYDCQDALCGCGCGNLKSDKPHG